MTNLRKDLELIEVVYQDEGKKAILTFLDEENGEVLEVNFNKQSYDTVSNSFKDDPEKSEKVEEWSKEYFETTFDKLGDCVGVKKDVYHYEKFNALWESKVTEKFDIADAGSIFTTKIERIEDDGKGIRIYFEHEGKEFESKMMYSDWVDARKAWFVNPQKKDRQYAKFEKKFGIPVEDKDKIAGKGIMVEIKTAFGKPYGEIKKPNWSK